MSVSDVSIPRRDAPGDADDATGSVARPSWSGTGSARHVEDVVYHGVTLIVSLSVVVILALIVVVLLTTAWPALGVLGLGFFVGTVWNPDAAIYGALPFITGTIVTTILALLLAVPVSLGIVLLLTEYLPRRVAAALNIVVDVAAGVPTVVFGLWSILFLIPWLSNSVEPTIAPLLGWFPLLDPHNSPADITGYGMIPAALVLATMVFPTIVSITRNSILATPTELREASLGLGATRWETATRVVLRQARASTIGAVVLASGRAIGEAIALVSILGNQERMPQSLWDEGGTLASELFVKVFGGVVPGTLDIAALYELGLVLLVLSLATGLIGRLLTRRLSGTVAVGGR